MRTIADTNDASSFLFTTSQIEKDAWSYGSEYHHLLNGVSKCKQASLLAFSKRLFAMQNFKNCE